MRNNLHNSTIRTVPGIPDYRARLIRLPIFLLLGLSSASFAYDLIPAQPSGFPGLSVNTTTSAIPGELRETNLATESIWTFRPGWSWSTTTNLTGTRHNSLLPFRTENSRITTGPRLKIGAADFFVPFQTGVETSTAITHMSWVSSTPGLKLAISDQDSIQIGAGFKSRRMDSFALQNLESSRSLSLSWRHLFAENLSMRIGLLQRTEIDNLRSDSLQEGYARLTARVGNNWWWTLSGSVSGIKHNFAEEQESGIRDISSTMSISARHPLGRGWEVSGSLSGTQTQPGGETGPVYNRAGSIKLYRGF